MSEIDQVHLRAVMLCMSETSEIVMIFNIHKIWWYGWKALSLSFPKLFFGLKIHWLLRKLWAKTSLTTTMQQCYSCLMSEMLEMWNISILCNYCIVLPLILSFTEIFHISDVSDMHCFDPLYWLLTNPLMYTQQIRWQWVWMSGFLTI